jgi:hypothetical protein
MMAQLHQVIGHVRDSRQVVRDHQLPWLVNQIRRESHEATAGFVQGFRQLVDFGYGWQNDHAVDVGVVHESYDVLDEAVAFDTAGVHDELITGIATYAQNSLLNLVNEQCRYVINQPEQK